MVREDGRYRQFSVRDDGHRTMKLLVHLRDLGERFVFTQVKSFANVQSVVFVVPLSVVRRD